MMESDLYQSLRYKNPGHRGCAVHGCYNHGKKLIAWLREQCPIHQCLRDLYLCTCIPPFLLIPLPKEESERKLWLKLISRRDPNDR